MGNSIKSNQPQLVFKHTQHVEDHNLFPESMMKIILQLVNG